ncbi:MAG: AraC family transcriptional regulator [Rhodocyclaceae bacterium]
MSRIIDHYREFYRRHDNVFTECGQASQATSSYSRYDVVHGLGSGWVDLYQINHGLTVGRGCFSLNTPWQCDYTNHTESLSLRILVSGRLRVIDETRRRCDDFGAGTVLLQRHRPAESLSVHYERAPGGPFSGISVELPIRLMQELLADTPSAHRSMLTDATDGVFFDLGCRLHRHGMHAARAMLALPSGSAIGRMRLEAAALDLITQVCTESDLFASTDGRHLPHQHRIAVGEAVAILEREFHEAHTITSLSARVQLNECYLKSAFRKITGATIAEFLRKQRMAYARHLIEAQQSTVLQAALSVGYSNPSHFTAAFRAVYGILPSNLKRVPT